MRRIATVAALFGTALALCSSVVVTADPEPAAAASPAQFVANVQAPSGLVASSVRVASVEYLVGCYFGFFDGNRTNTGTTGYASDENGNSINVTANLFRLGWWCDKYATCPSDSTGGGGCSLPNVWFSPRFSASNPAANALTVSLGAAVPGSANRARVTVDVGGVSASGSCTSFFWVIEGTPVSCNLQLSDGPTAPFTFRHHAVNAGGSGRIQWQVSGITTFQTDDDPATPTPNAVTLNLPAVGRALRVNATDLATRSWIGTSEPGITCTSEAQLTFSSATGSWSTPVLTNPTPVDCTVALRRPPAVRMSVRVLAGPAATFSGYVSVGGFPGSVSLTKRLDVDEATAAPASVAYTWYAPASTTGSLFASVPFGYRLAGSCSGTGGATAAVKRNRIDSISLPKSSSLACTVRVVNG